MEIKIVFRNEISGKELHAEVDPSESIDNVIDTLVKEGIIPDHHYDFFKSNNEALLKSSSFESAGLRGDDTILIRPIPETDDEFGELDDVVIVPRTFHQLGILVLDGSGSMKGQSKGGMTKAQAVNLAVRNFFTRITRSGVARNFSFEVINFDHTPSVLMPRVEGEDVSDSENYDPMQGGKGGGTQIGLALELARKSAREFIASSKAGGVPHSAVIILMTDGLCQGRERTLKVAKDLNEGEYSDKIKLFSAYFSSAAGNDQKAIDLMKSIVTDPSDRFTEVHDMETLRNFFLASVSASSNVEV